MFRGYSNQTVDFFWGIRFNNDREWFTAHREEYLRSVQEPTKALAEELFVWFRDTYPQLNLNLHMSRIYRDARRLFGRGPYKDHIWFSFQSAENWENAPCFYFEVGADGYGFGMGYYSTGAAIAQRFRKIVDQNPAALEQLLDGLRQWPELQLSGPEYARSKGHAGEKIESWYNKKSWFIGTSRSYDSVSYSPELASVLKNAYTFLVPYYQYLERAYTTAD